MRIVHRNLKLEDLIVDHEGYIAIAGFRDAKIIEDRTYTIVGTPHYIAPEVITGKGYSYSCDLWSMGVILYELIFCEMPFGEYSKDAVEIYTAVLFDDLRFPSENMDHPAVPIIKQLLNKAPFRRGTPASIKKHEWFTGMNWEDIYYRAIHPPFTPTMKLIDLSNPMSGSVQDVLLYEEYKEPIRGKLHPSKVGWDANF